MDLYFEHSDRRRTLVAENVSFEEVFDLIHADVEKRNPNFKIYYMRHWMRKGEYCYDFGSHTEFYILTPKGDHNAPHLRN